MEDLRSRVQYHDDILLDAFEQIVEALNGVAKLRKEIDELKEEVIYTKRNVSAIVKDVFNLLNVVRERGLRWI